MGEAPPNSRWCRGGRPARWSHSVIGATRRDRGFSSEGGKGGRRGGAGPLRSMHPAVCSIEGRGARCRGGAGRGGAGRAPCAGRRSGPRGSASGSSASPFLPRAPRHPPHPPPSRRAQPPVPSGRQAGVMLLRARLGAHPPRRVAVREVVNCGQRSTKPREGSRGAAAAGGCGSAAGARRGARNL